MTIAHLVFALLATGYILIAIQLEERDLIDAHPEYAGYRTAGAHADPPLRAGRSGGTPVSECA